MQPILIAVYSLQGPVWAMGAMGVDPASVAAATALMSPEGILYEKGGFRAWMIDAQNCVYLCSVINITCC